MTTSTPSQEEIPQYNGPGDYKGPTVGYLIKHNLLGSKIIETHPLAPANILDANNLAFLKRCVTDLSPEGTHALLAELDMLDAPGDEPGTRANKVYGSLVGYVIAKGGFSEGGIRELREWFDSGALGSELDGLEGKRGRIVEAKG
jgi:hypothetical protein